MWIARVSGSVICHRFDALFDRLVQAHRARDPELARIRPRARDHVVDLARARAAQPQLRQRAPDVVDALLADPAQHEVLLHRRPRVAAGVGAHDLRQAPELLGRQIAADDLRLDRHEALLLLRAHVRRAEALELREVPVRAAVGRRRRRGALALVVEEQTPLDREVTFGDPVALQLLLDLPAQLVDAELVHEHLDARPRAVHAQPVLAVEDPEHGLRDLQVVAVVELHELVQRRRHARHDRGAAADEHLRAAHRAATLGVGGLPDPRAEGDVVDAADRAVARRAIEGGLDLARHPLRRRVAHEVAHVRPRVGGQVEQLVRRHARPRVARDVAHRVAAALAAGEPSLAQLADRLLGLRQRDVVHLDVLARRDVALVQGHVPLDDLRELLHLLRRDAAEGQLHADHLHVRLALAVDALLEAELDELVFGSVAGQVFGGLGLEVVELPPQDRDHVPGHVLQDLRVLQRAARGLGWRS